MHNIAVIGAGRIGAIHAASIAAHPDLTLACVADATPTAARALATRHAARVVDIDTALSLPDIAGVVIASPTPTHVDLMLAAARHGKAVFCEKPVDLDLDRARAAATALDALGARVLIGFNRRFDPHFHALRDRLRAGTIGALEAVHIVSHDPAPPPTDYLATSGGLFRDMVIHDFDMASWLLDAPVTGVFARAACLIDPAIAAAGDVDTARTILTTADGRMATISSSRRSGYGYDQRIEAFGSTGLLRVDNLAQTMVEHWSADGRHHAPVQHFFIDRYADAYRREIAHFADMLGGAPAMVDHHDGVAALALADAAERSIASGRIEPVWSGIRAS
ncbi:MULTISPECIES: inositol 2-dehydrogenase [unclassified Sphingomonas]|uniref:inositol 2-dehydrogenase n=1 Tax=unclassified Sphingomonas TaxID=196159 RepID=UPI0006F931EE|nr:MULTISPECIES: inositol 2-dehydrogenase [unclassified Sphingomonas]KQM61404.1 inositol 2-dehydrogenase [Sphingomonas sp. Leaf16]KQN12499.1 inositol 2-dehydrogenase [Sphingomonas sp. Leaf29]KQN18979.1 inositol 2-dehydrogenase [Sphingomonas sp. Leaf32]